MSAMTLESWASTALPSIQAGRALKLNENGSRLNPLSLLSFFSVGPPYLRVFSPHPIKAETQGGEPSISQISTVKPTAGSFRQGEIDSSVHYAASLMKGTHQKALNVSLSFASV
jgi:hypothetical protein